MRPSQWLALGCLAISLALGAGCEDEESANKPIVNTPTGGAAPWKLVGPQGGAVGVPGAIQVTVDEGTVLKQVYVTLEARDPAGLVAVPSQYVIVSRPYEVLLGKDNAGKDIELQKPLHIELGYSAPPADAGVYPSSAPRYSGFEVWRLSNVKDNTWSAVTGRTAEIDFDAETVRFRTTLTGIFVVVYASPSPVSGNAPDAGDGG